MSDTKRFQLLFFHFQDKKYAYHKDMTKSLQYNNFYVLYVF
jgi:hypothetical protein